MSLNYYIEYNKDVDGFTKFVENESKKEQERLKEYGQDKSDKTSNKTDSKSDSKKESMGSVSKGRTAWKSTNARCTTNVKNKGNRRT